MGGFFGVAAKDDCVFDLFFGIDYHSHLGTRRGGMTVYGRTCARYRCWSGRKYSYHKKAPESVVLNAVRAMHKKFTNCYYFFRNNMCYNADK